MQIYSYMAKKFETLDGHVKALWNIFTQNYILFFMIWLKKEDLEA